MEPVEVSREIDAPIDEVFSHFVDPSEELRLGLHEEHVKAYKELAKGENSLAYSFVFQSFGFRFGGKAREEFQRPHLTRIWVDEGPLKDAIIDLKFEETERGTTIVRQITAIPDSADGPLRKILGQQMRARIHALTAVHLDQHGRDIEGLEPKSYLTPGEARAVAIMEVLRSVRAISLPMILMPLIAGAALASTVGEVSGWRLALTLIGGALALFAGNLTNDIWDFSGGADHAAIGTEGATLTGSGALLYGTFTPKQAWAFTGVLLAIAVACGAALTVGHPWAPVFAVAGVGVAMLYQAPPFRLSYRGYGLGELCIWAAFGPVPVAGAYYVQTGTVSPAAWVLGAVVGLGAALVLYCHHFLQWEADLEAEKMGPIATLGPRRGAKLGVVIALLFAAVLGASPWLLGAPMWAALSGLPPLLLLPALWRVARQGNEAISFSLLQRAGEAFALGVGVLSVVLFTA
ncbi:MAG: UbiA family prenyltransferase [Chrysiogenetes bacterium]|nr:UbiA family prenyltransferase [Chrysiogenetes bacterium]